jgi:hypothetical protein
MSSSLLRLLQKLVQRKIVLKANPTDPDKLMYCPQNAVDADLLQELAEHKTAILDLLHTGRKSEIPSIILNGWKEDFEERAAILEYDGGLAREEAERQALREIEERNS